MEFNRNKFARFVNLVTKEKKCTISAASNNILGNGDAFNKYLNDVEPQPVTMRKIKKWADTNGFEFQPKDYWD